MDKAGTSAPTTSGDPNRKPQNLGQCNLPTSESEMEERVMRRRLLIDGANHDRRVVGLTKSFLSFCNNEDETPDEAKLSLTRMMSQLRQVEFDAHKNYTEVSKIQEAKKMYGNLKRDIKVETERTKEIISETAKTLVKGREHKAKMSQCDALTRLLLQQPDSKMISEQKERVNQELRQLEEKHLAQAMAMKRKSETLNTLVGVFDLVEDAIQDEAPAPNEKLSLALFRPEYSDTDNETSHSEATDHSPIRSTSEYSDETVEMEETQCLPYGMVIEEVVYGSRTPSPEPEHLSENNGNIAPNVSVDQKTETSPGVLSSVGENCATNAADLMDEVTLMGFFNKETGVFSETYQPQREKYSRERTPSVSDTSSVSVESISTSPSP